MTRQRQWLQLECQEGVVHTHTNTQTLLCQRCVCGGGAGVVGDQLGGTRECFDPTCRQTRRRAEPEGSVNLLTVAALFGRVCGKEYGGETALVCRKLPSTLASPRVCSANLLGPEPRGLPHIHRQTLHAKERRGGKEITTRSKTWPRGYGKGGDSQRDERCGGLGTSDCTVLYTIILGGDGQDPG